MNLIPIIKELPGDLDTPVSAFLKLNEADSFLLESVTGGETIARYSFIGARPFASLISRDNSTQIRTKNGESISEENPIDLLEQFHAQYQLEDSEFLPPFMGGAVGFFSWEIIAHIENITLAEKNGTPFPLMHFLFPGIIIAFDHAERKIILVGLADEKNQSALLEQLKEIETKLAAPHAGESLPIETIPDEDIFKNVSCNIKKDDYKAAVEKAKHYIKEGDAFQIGVSQKFTLNSDKSSFTIYRSLRRINPSPYMFYFNFDDYQIIGSSPEIQTRLEGRKATLRPIAGTRPRIAGKEEELMKELQKDQKEIAEHIMLVDLGRNDLGRVCEYHSIQTADLMSIEKYSHVLHMVTNIEGQLKPDKTAFDLFKATFPAGTLSGAPKVRAIELIEEIEPDKRGLYGGALGYFDFRGNMDLCIIIRTIIGKNKQYYVQAGAGIVADSDPESEYEECRSKAKGVIKACY